VFTGFFRSLGIVFLGVDFATRFTSRAIPPPQTFWCFPLKFTPKVSGNLSEARLSLPPV